MKIKRIIFRLQELFRRKPKTKKAGPMFHAPLNEPFAAMAKQHLASQYLSFSSMQDQRLRQQCFGTANQREWMCRNAQMQIPPQPRLPGLSVDIRTNPSPSIPNGQLWHFPKGTVGRVEIKETIPFAIHSAIVDALAEAKEKHPRFADNIAEAGNVILEELLEVNAAGLSLVQKINDQKSRDNLFIELAQLNATTIRMMERLLK